MNLPIGDRLTDDGSPYGNDDLLFGEVDTQIPKVRYARDPHMVPAYGDNEYQTTLKREIDENVAEIRHISPNVHLRLELDREHSLVEIEITLDLGYRTEEGIPTSREEILHIATALYDAISGEIITITTHAFAGTDPFIVDQEFAQTPYEEWVRLFDEAVFAGFNSPLTDKIMEAYLAAEKRTVEPNLEFRSMGMVEIGDTFVYPFSVEIVPEVFRRSERSFTERHPLGIILIDSDGRELTKEDCLNFEIERQQHQGFGKVSFFSDELTLEGRSPGLLEYLVGATIVETKNASFIDFAIDTGIVVYDNQTGNFRPLRSVIRAPMYLDTRAFVRYLDGDKTEDERDVEPLEERLANNDKGSWAFHVIKAI